MDRIDSRLRLTFTSATVLTVNVQTGMRYRGFYYDAPDDRLHVTLPSGKHFDSVPLAVDSAVVGEGGIETAVPPATACYYVYVVASQTSGRLAAIASLNSPAAGGPAGYNPGEWIYVGCQPFTFGVGWTQFVQVGSKYRYVVGITIENAVAGADLAPVAIDLATVGLPPTPELTVVAECGFVIGGGASLIYRLYNDTDGGTTPSIMYAVRADFNAAVPVSDAREGNFDASLGFIFRERQAGGAGETATSAIVATAYVDPFLDA